MNRRPENPAVGDTYYNLCILADTLGGNTEKVLWPKLQEHNVLADACGNITHIDGKKVIRKAAHFRLA